MGVWVRHSAQRAAAISELNSYSTLRAMGVLGSIGNHFIMGSFGRLRGLHDNVKITVLYKNIIITNA